MMNINLFKLALDRLQPSDWQVFEEFSSTFLATEFGKLRTMAHPSGDGGRDSELFQQEGTTFIAFQYSLQKDWKKKILQTVKRLKSELPTVLILIYMSNQHIGGQADELKKEILQNGLSLDTRDKNWFLERAALDLTRESAAEQLIDRIARPYLISEDLIKMRSSPLSSNEARAALLYLGLQWQDDITDKGLTKLSFDALVRATLRHTDTDNRISRIKVHENIYQLLPSAKKEILCKQIDSALARLTKRFIRHWQKEDEFCLTHEEHQRILIRLAEIENLQTLFYDEAIRYCEICLGDVNKSKPEDIEDLGQRIPRVIEKLLLHRGEAFVSAVVSGKLNRIGFEHLMDIILDDLSVHPPTGNITQFLPKIIEMTVQNVLANPSESAQLYLRRLADSYTLFSFLREIPDVQSATRKLFSHGAIWLDTTVLLPFFAERLEENESQWKFTHLYQACDESGIELYVTPGIIEEINSHMDNAKLCSQYYNTQLWRGRTPYLFDQFLKTGKQASEFSKWLEMFRGNERKDEDIELFLSEILRIKKRGLSVEVEMVDKELRHAADRLWSDEHHERRKQKEQFDDSTTDHLIKNDLETYLGVIALRLQEQVTELGYKHWLLTLDKIAWQIRDRLQEEFNSKTPPSPLMSLDFLVNNLTFGPERRYLTRTEEQALPIVLDIEMSESMPQDILNIADKVRKDNEGLPEYVIQRKVRDAIDNARRRRTCLGSSSNII